MSTTTEKITQLADRVRGSSKEQLVMLAVSLISQRGMQDLRIRKLRVALEVMANPDNFDRGLVFLAKDALKEDDRINKPVMKDH